MSISVLLEVGAGIEFTERSASGSLATLCYPRLSSVAPIRRPAFVDEGENASTRVELDNADGSLAWIFATSPPQRAAVSIYNGSDRVFRGTISSIEYGATIGLGLEGGLDWPMSDPLPLRDTSAWGSYEDLRTIPHVYGRRVRLAPIRYDRDGQRWVAADHALSGAGILEVYRDDALTTAWTQSSEQDALGHVVHVLTLAQPLARGEELVIVAQGKAHPVTGAVLENPADILWDILANVAGLPILESELDDFREETGNAGMVLAGVLDGGKSIRGTLSAILGSVGAIWSAAMPGIARLWPDARRGDPYHATLTASLADLGQSESAQGDIATRLVIKYGYDWAAKDHRSAIRIAAPDQIEEYGEIDREIDAGWIHSSRLAYLLGQRMIRYLAVPRWRVPWDLSLDDTIEPGSWVNLSHALSPSSGAAMVIASEIDLSNHRQRIMCEPEPSSSIRVRLDALATAFEPVPASGATITYGDGEVTFTLLSASNVAEANARVTLDGSVTRTADIQGRVTFTAAVGPHLLYVQPTDGDPYEIAVNV